MSKNETGGRLNKAGVYIVESIAPCSGKSVKCRYFDASRFDYLTIVRNGVCFARFEEKIPLDADTKNESYVKFHEFLFASVSVRLETCLGIPL